MEYGGDVSPSECWEKLKSGASAALVDVRTRVEWNFIGMPALDEADAPLLSQEWQVFPKMSVDPDFVVSLKNQISESGLDENSELYFLCRSGARSLAAARAMTADGFKKCFNISGGFEGDLDENAHRGKKDGWKAAGLPWRQK